MTSERSKRRDFLSLIFIAKSISKKLLIVIRNFEISRVVFMPKYHVQIMLLFVYTTTRKRFVIFTCRYFKLS